MTDEPIPFEQHLTRVEDAIRRLESGDVPLEDSIDLYAEAMRHLHACHAVLETAEARLESVKKGAGGASEAVADNIVD